MCLRGCEGGGTDNNKKMNTAEQKYKTKHIYKYPPPKAKSITNLHKENKIQKT